ncbi:MAG TPA: adenylate/guanylate cyclase domain-containing protein [Gaiellales bacterium]
MRPDLHYARNGDIALAYQVVGDGPRDVLLVSGFLSNLEYAWMYPSMARFLTRLAGFSRLILMDRRGSGLSDRVWNPAPIETTLEDVEAVLDAAGSPKTTLIGLWDGCLTSALYAAAHPDRVASLVLFGSSPAQTASAEYPWAWDERTWSDWLASIREGWGTRAWVVRNARWMAPGMLDDPVELEHWIAYTRLAASPSSAEAVMRIHMHTDIRQVLPVVHAPTLVLHRTGDQVEPIEAGRYVAAKVPDARFVELAGDDGIPWIGDADAVLREIETFVTGDAAPRPRTDRRLATVLFTDIVASTEHVVSLGDSVWQQLLTKHDEVVRRELARCNGRFIDSAGDGMLATFEGPAAAIRCAQAVMNGVGGIGLELRAGVHTGEVEADGDHVRGIAVHLCARIAALAGRGEILVSSTVRDLTAGSGIEFEDAGEHTLKGFPGQARLHRCVTPAAAAL